MIPSDDDFVPMRLRVQPVERGLQLGKRPALCQIASVDQNVSVGKLWLAVVRIGNADDRNGVVIAWRIRAGSKSELPAKEFAGEEDYGSLPKLLPSAFTMPKEQGVQPVCPRPLTEHS